MDIQEIYQSKLKTPEEAAKMIENGDRIYLGSLAACPGDFLFELEDRWEELEDVYITSCSLVYDMSFMTDPKFLGHINYGSFFPMPPFERANMALGIMDYNSVAFSRMPHYLNNVLKVNATALAVSPMDEDGYFWHGPNGNALNSYIIPHCKGKVIVQVCKDTPLSYGDTPESEKMHISEVDAIIEEDMPFIAVPAAEISEVDQKIADLIVPYVKDGSTIQLGIGGLANAIGYGLVSKKDLNCFTEMVGESTMHLMEKGVITGKVIGGFALGGEALMKYCNKNERIELRPIDRVCNSEIIGKIDNMVSINGCLMVDLTGQVASEGVGTKRIASTGGATDFMKGACMSKGGVNFMTLPSTTEFGGKTVSNIVMALPPSTPVTVPRVDVMNVVTEYGVADIYCRCIRERAEALIKIAHPDFREELTAQAREAKYIL